MTNAKYQRRAYQTWIEAQGLEDNYSEDAQSFFREDTATINPQSNVERFSSITVGTDCSGLEAPILALKEAGIKHIHSFACDNNEDVKKDYPSQQ